MEILSAGESHSSAHKKLLESSVANISQKKKGKEKRFRRAYEAKRADVARYCRKMKCAEFLCLEDPC